MKISFIVPLYNEDKVIKACLDSIVSEMKNGDEIIVIDNGSTDNSIKFVKSYNGIKLFRKPKLTIAGLRNFGARLASGELLAFIDADCIICPNWRINVIDTMSNADVAACGSKYDIPVGARWIEKAWFSQKRKSEGKVNYINSGNLVVKKDIFIEAGGFNEDLVTGEDAEFGLRLDKANYVIWENPMIKVIHLGNPKDIWSFYKKQCWHGLGMFGTMKISFFDKPVLMTALFLLFLIFGIISFFLINNIVFAFSSISFFLFFIPIVSAFYRVMQYQNFIYFPHLVVLYLLYFLARINALFKITIGQV